MLHTPWTSFGSLGNVSETVNPCARLSSSLIKGKKLKVDSKYASSRDDLQDDLAFRVSLDSLKGFNKKK